MTDVPGEHPLPHPELQVQTPLIFTLKVGETEARLPGLIVVCFGRFWVRGLPFPNAMHLGPPFQWKNTLPWHLGPAAKVRILRFKNLPPFRHDPGLQIPRLRYSPGLAPTTRLNALLNAASDS
jgi:hypothetical protein